MSPTSLCYNSVEGANFFATTSRSANDAVVFPTGPEPSAGKRRALQTHSTLATATQFPRSQPGVSGAQPRSSSATSSPHMRSRSTASSASSPALNRVFRAGKRSQHGSEVDKTYRLMRRTSNVLRASPTRRRSPSSASKTLDKCISAVSGEASTSRFGAGWSSPRSTNLARPRSGAAAAAATRRSKSSPNDLTCNGGFGVPAPRRSQSAESGASGRSSTPLSQVGSLSDGGSFSHRSLSSQLPTEAQEQMRPEVAPEIALETIAQHLRPCSLSLLLITVAFGPYDAFEFGDDWHESFGSTRSLQLVLLLRYCACVPLCLIGVGVIHMQLRHGLRDKTHMQSLGCGLMLVATTCFFVLILAAPNKEHPRPMWATAMLVVHQWFMYTVLALEVVPQTALIAVFSAVGGFLVWWSQLHAIDELIASSKDERDSARLGDERDSALIALVSWSLIFHVLGLRHTMRRRAGLLRHAQHRQRSTVCAEHIMEEVEACKKLLENIFPPQVLSELQLNLRLGASERAAVVAQEFEGCTFLFAKLVGLRHLVESADPRWLLELLQTTFDRFDTLAETFSVQRVRKTVNESYMVAAGLPDPTLLRSPVDRALATAGFGLALCGVMDVLNAQMAQRMGGGKGSKRRGGGGFGGGVGGGGPPTLAVQVGINSGSAIAGVIGHRRIQYDLVGDAVNTAARMCSYGAPGRVHVSAATYEHLAPHYLATSRGPRQIKGKGLMTTYFLERLCASSASASASAPASASASAPASASNAAGKRPIASNATAPPIAEVTAQEVVGEAAVSKAREEAEVARATAAAAVQAAATAVAKADALETLVRAVADAGEDSSSGAAGPLEASEATEVPDAPPAVTPAEFPPAGWHAPPAVPPHETPGDYHGD